MSSFFQKVKLLFANSFLRNLAINLFLGLLVVSGMLYFSDSLWLMEAEDASMDWLMQVNQNTILPIHENNIPPVVMLDVDDKTYYDWGRPLFTPRKPLKNMIEVAVEAKARLIIVDLDVSQRTHVEGSQLHLDDQILKDYLKGYIAKCKEKNRDKTACPPIILRRALNTRSSSSVPTLWSSFLDDVVTHDAAPYVQWASRQFYPAADGVVRRWKLWQLTCASDNQLEVIPSVELLVMGFVKEECVIQDVQNTLHFLLKKYDNSCVPQQLSETVNFCGWTINRKDRRGINNQRITYRISWANLVLDEAKNPVLTVLPAQPYTEPPLQESTEALTDSIVILGKSYSEGYDIYSTSLKDMPGTLIIVNAIYSLLQPEKIELPIGIRLFINVLFIGFISIFFNEFFSYGGIIVLSILTIFILLPLTMIFFHGGVWFNLALPLIGLVFIRVIVKYQVYLTKKLYLRFK